MVFIAWSITLLAAVEICLGLLPLNPWSLLGTNHLLHHVWLWLSFGMYTSAWVLLVIGLGGLLLDRTRLRQDKRFTIPSWIPRAGLLVSLLGLPLVQFLTILLHQPTLSTGSGMEQALSSKFYELIDKHLVQQNLPPLLSKAQNDSAQRLRDVSRSVIDRELLKRDLVITGSRLGQTSEDLPSDLYFHARADQTTSPPPFGVRGISFTDRPDVLLDVVMGSGSIFPVFPSRVIENLPREGEQIELIDGGFAHNSPIEAAVLWGATHVILLEASPRQRTERGNFLLNTSSAFQHLYRQAQLIDTRSRGRVNIYSLAPQPPHMCVLDFADNLIHDSINRGYRDVTTRRDAFQRELGEPMFSVVMVSKNESQAGSSTTP